jgi:hypothetical protein
MSLESVAKFLKRPWVRVFSTLLAITLLGSNLKTENTSAQAPELPKINPKMALALHRALLNAKDQSSLQVEGIETICEDSVTDTLPSGDLVKTDFYVGKSVDDVTGQTNYVVSSAQQVTSVEGLVVKDDQSTLFVTEVLQDQGSADKGVTLTWAGAPFVLYPKPFTSSSMNTRSGQLGRLVASLHTDSRIVGEQAAASVFNVESYSAYSLYLSMNTSVSYMNMIAERSFACMMNLRSEPALPEYRLFLAQLRN